MTATTCTVIGLVLWAVALSLLLVGVRLGAILGGKPLNTFAPDGRDLGAFGQRVTRAHGNTLENLALLVALPLFALATERSGLTDGLAPLVLYARLGQSVIHLVSTSRPAVLLRAALFAVQLAVILIWVWRLYPFG